MPVSAQHSAPPVQVLTSNAPVRLEFLSGLRGLAALYVVLFHAYQELNWQVDGSTIPRPLAIALKPLTFGHFAVDLFIVLSGYCLMLPVVRSAEENLRGGVAAYLARRARRILPPYYAALTGVLLLLAATTYGGRSPGEFWSAATPAFTPGVLLSHLFLVQNLLPQWFFKIDPPMWSVSLEWQIYFVFPLLLLPAWRRLGTRAALAIALILGMTPHLLLPADRNGDWTCPWYIGLFGLGMAGASIGFSRRAWDTDQRRRIPWLALAAAFPLGIVIPALFSPGWCTRHYAIVDTLVGASAISLIGWCAKRSLEPAPAPSTLVALLESRIVTGLGDYSYSLYLIHVPVLALVDWPLRAMGFPPLVRLLLLICAGIPISLGAAYLFFRAVERRFLATTRRRVDTRVEATQT